MNIFFLQFLNWNYYLKKMLLFHLNVHYLHFYADYLPENYFLDYYCYYCAAKKKKNI